MVLMCAGAPGLAKRPLFKGKGDGGDALGFCIGALVSHGVRWVGKGANTPPLLSLQASDTPYPITFPFNITYMNQSHPTLLSGP